MVACMVGPNHPTPRHDILHACHVLCGTTATVATSTPTTWRVATGASGVVWSDVYGGEIYNASAVVAGWDLANFDDSQWDHPVSLSPASVPLSDTLSVHAYAPIRIIATVSPVNITHIGSTGAYLVWFPANEAGVINLVNVTGPSGATITLTHREILKDADGNLCLVGCWGNGTEVRRCVMRYTTDRANV